jgi:predicted metal-dependent HD superfamily phosphohydrolase
VLQASPAPGLLEDLLARYSEPQRRYHTVRHLEECFQQFDLLEPLAGQPAEISLGLWFHDAVYDTHRHDNEERSAEWARSAVPATAAERVHELVMATRHDAVPRDIDAQVLVDVDLSILGARPERFDEYEMQVREEYGWVPGFVYRRKRKEILESLLARPTLFNTAPFIERYEKAARENLSRSIARL